MFNKSIFMQVTVVLFLAVCLLFMVPERHAISEEIGLSDYDVPEAKKDKWESVRNQVQKSYRICIEHCGNSTDCMRRCEHVYQDRLEKEYKNLMSE